MADSLTDLIEKFDDLIAGLNGDWRLHKELFQDETNNEVLSKVAPTVWFMLRDALIDSVFMSIARLLDPAKLGSKDNLSIERVLLEMPAGSARDRIKKGHGELAVTYDSAIRHWRNRKLSHNDLRTVTGVAALPNVSYGEISDLVARINSIGHDIGIVMQDCAKSFIPQISNEHWVWKLIDTLKKGIGDAQTG